MRKGYKKNRKKPGLFEFIRFLWSVERHFLMRVFWDISLGLVLLVVSTVFVVRFTGVNIFVLVIVGVLAVAIVLVWWKYDRAKTERELMEIMQGLDVEHEGKKK